MGSSGPIKSPGDIYIDPTADLIERARQALEKDAPQMLMENALADPKHAAGELLHLACRLGHANSVTDLLDAGVDPWWNPNGLPAFLIAILYDKADCLREFIVRGVDLHRVQGMQDNVRLLPIQEALTHKAPECARELLRHGFDPDEVHTKDQVGLGLRTYRMPALHRFTPHEEYFQLLLHGGADPNRVDPINGNHVGHLMLIEEDRACLPNWIRVLDRLDLELANHSGRSCLDLLRIKRGPFWEVSQAVLAAREAKAVIQELGRPMNPGADSLELR